MPDRMYRMRAGQRLDYEVEFKRRREDRHAIPSDAAVEHGFEVGVTKLGDAPEVLEVAIGGATRRVAITDSLLPVYVAVRELVAERGGAPEVGDCAMIWRLRER